MYPEIDRILSVKTYKRIGEFVRRNTIAPQDQSMEMGEWYAYHLSLKKKMSDRARIGMIYHGWYLKIAVKPNDLDEAVFKLRSVSYPFCFFIRAVRLFRNKRHEDLRCNADHNAPASRNRR